LAKATNCQANAGGSLQRKDSPRAEPTSCTCTYAPSLAPVPFHITPIVASVSRAPAGKEGTVAVATSWPRIIVLGPHFLVPVPRFLAALSFVHFVPFSFVNLSTVRSARSTISKNANHPKTCNYCDICKSFYYSPTNYIE
jgi:hypothetical protein